MKLFVQNNTDSAVAAFLSKYFNCISVPENSLLDRPVSSHIDMQIFIFPDKTAVCAPFCLEFYKKNLPDFTILSGAMPQSPYPYDVLYNCFIAGNCLFCNERATDKTILSYARKLGLKIVRVAQGYAKCSTIIVSKTKIITSDPSIRLAAEKEGLSVLKTVNDTVFLQGYDSGFIGGASFVTDNALFFTGDISKHPDYDRILSFSEKKVFFINNRPLYDYGNINPV